MWLCMSEPTLQEAFVYRKENFPVLASFLNRHLVEMPGAILDRVCKLFDPSTTVLRPIVRLIPMPEDEESFPVDKLVQFFLTALLIRIGKNRMDYDKSLMLPFEDPVKEDSPPRDLDGCEVADEAIWAIRKNRRGLGIFLIFAFLFLALNRQFFGTLSGTDSELWVLAYRFDPKWQCYDLGDEQQGLLGTGTSFTAEHASGIDFLVYQLSATGFSSRLRKDSYNCLDE